MKIKNECLPCIYRQTLEACQMITGDKQQIREILKEVALMISEVGEETAPRVTERIQQLIKDKVGVDDPYLDFKEDNLRQSLVLYDKIKQSIEAHEQPLTGALIMAATGNAIDAGVTLDIDVDKIVDKALEQGFARDNLPDFQKLLKPNSRVMIIGDNTGEAVFDKLLIEELHNYNVEVTYAVRECPILNDVTLREAREIGLDQVSRVISSGSRAPGMVLAEATEEFMEYFKSADIVISKGQGNLEGLSGEVERPIFFLLKAKCGVIADLLGVNEGELVFVLKN
ncbi:MAG: damage-control phosphatase ARMT1 family protein [Bacillota bacterium]